MAGNPPINDPISRQGNVRVDSPAWVMWLQKLTQVATQDDSTDLWKAIGMIADSSNEIRQVADALESLGKLHGMSGDLVDEIRVLSDRIDALNKTLSLSRTYDGEIQQLRSGLDDARKTASMGV